MQSNYILITCQMGAEQALKSEVYAKHPELRLAFSRPGFVTFKCDQKKDLEFRPELVFGRTFSLSMGKSKGDLIDCGNNAAKLAKELDVQGIHLFSREASLEVIEESPKKIAARDSAEAKCVQALSKVTALPVNIRARSGQRIMDVVLVEADGAEFEWWYGLHEHGDSDSPWPGGIYRVEQPPQAPSRAFLKIEEAAIFPGLGFLKGDTALELGSAPGGVAYSLLERGLKVGGVDLADMDPRVLAAPGFVSFRKHAKQLTSEMLKKEGFANIDWLLSDMNIEPFEMLDAVESVLKLFEKKPLGLVLTLKFSQWTSVLGDLEKISKALGRLGFAKTRARQLFQNRKEICLIALSPEGVERHQALGLLAVTVR